MRGVALKVVLQLVGRAVPETSLTRREAEDLTNAAASGVRASVEDLVPPDVEIEALVTTEPLVDELIAASRSASLIVLGVEAAHTVDEATAEATAREVAPPQRDRTGNRRPAAPVHQCG